MKVSRLSPQYVLSFPKELKEGVLYISEEYSTAAHLCCCGCGEKVITPLNPAKWRLIKAGGEVSLHPSIGNWRFACKSHYILDRGRVIDAGIMSASQIEAVLARDKRDNQRYIEARNQSSSAINPSAEPGNSLGIFALAKTLLLKLWNWLRGL